MGFGGCAGGFFCLPWELGFWDGLFCQVQKSLSSAGSTPALWLGTDMGAQEKGPLSRVHAALCGQGHPEALHPCCVIIIQFCFLLWALCPRQGDMQLVFWIIFTRSTISLDCTGFLLNRLGGGGERVWSDI